MSAAGWSAGLGGLRRLAAPAEERSRRQAARLGDLAASRGLLDVGVGEVETPVGRLLVAVTRRGLVRVAFPEEEPEAVLEELALRISPRILRSPRMTEEARRQLEEFFQGRRRRFELAVDPALMGGFARRVLARTARIPYGRVRTYGELAAALGAPRAARAVGNALGANPVPIVVPCHRVVRAGGDLGGYGGGPERKEWLLRLEGALP
ncbi:MAG TPA: methylated-DNA--[protein]-cysteine S-methyltransferase [Actinomycetota bacterium]|nr:methylated-DNA--[protein]-cysteine S-methyltransferase [Actinomycetota bacterium]